jgi:2-iminobutanoate/2-iminopropanoate deaminase
VTLEMPKQIHDVASAPAPVGPYSVATEANGFVFVSGQVGIDPATGSVVAGGAAAEARQIMSNVGAILGEVGLGYGDIVKATIFVTDIGEFAAINEAYGSFVASSKPARSTVQVAALPLGVSVEIEVLAAR